MRLAPAEAARVDRAVQDYPYSGHGHVTRVAGEEEEGPHNRLYVFPRYVVRVIVDQTTQTVDGEDLRLAEALAFRTPSSIPTLSRAEAGLTARDMHAIPRMNTTPNEAWPGLPWEAWKDTCETLHMCTQVVGKVKLALSPFLNQWWQVAFDVTARGLTTSAIPSRRGVFQIDFDFIDHALRIATSDGETRSFALSARPVCDFHADLMAALSDLAIDVKINPMPVEVPEPIRCDEDRSHASYDPEYVQRWWRILIGTTKVLQRHRSTFVGKSSPILFYWGSFDLNTTRFSGRPAPLMEGAPRFYQLAEDRENVACGFWPGNPSASGVTLGEPAFYSYIYPAPPGYRDAKIRPAAVKFHESLGEYILPYHEARRAASPDETILEFFRSAYEAAADRAAWDRAALERRG